MFNKKGFSLVQTMVAMGVAGAIAVGTMKTMQNAAKVQRTAERSATISQLYSQAYTSLSSSASCDATLTQASLLNSVLEVNDPPVQFTTPVVQMVPDSANPGSLIPSPVLAVNDNFGGVGYSGASVVRTGPAELTFYLNFEKEQLVNVNGTERRNTYGGRVRTRSIRVSALFGPGNELLECNGADSVLADSIQQDFCVDSLGGTWDTSTNPPTCTNMTDINEEVCTSVLGGTWDTSTTPANCINMADIGESVCQVIGGSWNGNQCNGTRLGLYCNEEGSACIDPEFADCPPGRVLVGFNDNTGVGECEPVAQYLADTLSCNEGDSLIFSGGSITCESGGSTTTTTVTSTTTTVPPGMCQQGMTCINNSQCNGGTCQQNYFCSGSWNPPGIVMEPTDIGHTCDSPNITNYKTYTSSCESLPASTPNPGDYYTCVSPNRARVCRFANTEYCNGPNTENACEAQNSACSWTMGSRTCQCN